MRAYNKDAADEIIKQLTSLPIKGINKICKDIGISTATVYDWIVEDFEGFGKKYARAKAIQADLAVEDAYGIADDSSNDTVLDDFGNPRENKEWTNRSRMRVDLRKWHAAKLAPRVYGEKLDISGQIDVSHTVNIAPHPAFAESKDLVKLSSDEDAVLLFRDAKYLQDHQKNDLKASGHEVKDAEDIDFEDVE